MIDRLLTGLASLSLRHSKLIAIVALFVGIASLAAGAGLTFDPDLQSVIGRNDGQIDSDSGGTIDRHIVVVPLPKGRDVREYDQLIADIAGGYRSSRRIADVQYTALSGPTRGYIVSADRSMLLILAQPNRPVRDMPFVRELLAEGAIIETRALNEWQKRAAPGTPMPRIEQTGSYQIAAGDVDLIRADVTRGVLVAFFGSLLLLLYAFRRVAVLLYAALTVALTLAMTFAVAALTFGRLTSVSGGFAALVTGLGMGFVAIYYARYAAERNRGASVAEGLVVTFRAAMPGIIVGGLGIAAAFFALLAADFRGMSELGVLTGAGVVLMLLGVVFLLPSLIVLGERGGAKRASKVTLHAFGADRLVRHALAHPKPTVIFWTIFTIAFAVAATQGTLRGGLGGLRSPANAGVSTQQQIAGKFGPLVDASNGSVSDRTDASLRQTVRADAVRSTSIAIVAVLLLLLVRFRNARRVLLAFAPFLAGAIGMLGFMAVLRLELNFMSIFAALMIIGCAAGHALYVLERHVEDPAAFAVNAAETGKAVMSAGLMAIVGYGSFALSHFPGLRSIGYASSFGIGASALVP